MDNATFARMVLSDSLGVRQMMQERAGYCQETKRRPNGRSKGKCGNRAYFCATCPAHGGPPLDAVVETIYDEYRATGKLPAFPAPVRPHRKVAADSAMAALARRAGELRFDDSAHAQFTENNALRLVHRNCYAARGFHYWAVKLHIAGKSRTLGIFGPAYEYHATRFADLCIVRFWKYRRAGARVVSDDNLNYTVELADHSLNTHFEAAGIVSEIGILLAKLIVDAPATPG